jgi:hypothetical protein
MTGRQLARHVVMLCFGLGACSDVVVVTDQPPLYEPWLVTSSDDRNAAGMCSADRFPINSGNPVSCCQDGNRAWYTDDGTRLVFRTYGNACTEEDGIGTNCGGDTGIPCTYGPCGQRNEWAVDAAAVAIFRPDSKPGKCGWEARGVIGCVLGCDWPAGALRVHPEGIPVP